MRLTLRKWVQPGFFEAYYQGARKKLRRTSFRNVEQYMEQYTNELIQAQIAFRSKRDVAHLTEMKWSIAAIQACVDELDEDLKTKTR